MGRKQDGYDDTNKDILIDIGKNMDLLELNHGKILMLEHLVLKMNDLDR